MNTFNKHHWNREKGKYTEKSMTDLALPNLQKLICKISTLTLYIQTIIKSLLHFVKKCKHDNGNTQGKEQ